MARIAIARPPGRHGGNLATATNWKQILTRLGHQVTLSEGWAPHATGAADVLIALHARRSAQAIQAWRRASTTAALIVAATGTDLYQDLTGSRSLASEALAGFEAADRILVLQDKAPQALPEHLRSKARVIYQSVCTPAPHERARPPVTPPLQVCLLAELRPVKDPLLVLEALKRIPTEIQVQVSHAGPATDAELERTAKAATESDTRYHWLGPCEHAEALNLLAQSHLTLNTSLSEGGARALGEALSLDVPILASDVAGNRGMLGDAHPGLFPVGDAQALAHALSRAAQEPSYREQLRDAGRERLILVRPQREEAAWAALLDELLPSGGS